MFFTRRIQKTHEGYALLTIPRAIMSAWPNVEKLDMIFDEQHDVIVVTPHIKEII